MIVFENNGEIDPRLITTMGVNAKEGDSAIGFFGTGLKYAIAAMLRLGEHIEIHSGLKVYTFAKQEEEIRGKKFYMIRMVERDGEHTEGMLLGFTTELGKTWEPWMIYRELWCNCKDEGGVVSEAPEDYPYHIPQADLTRIIVSGKQIEAAHAERSSFLLLTKPLHEDKNLAVHPGTSEFIFYRGIRAGKLGTKSLYTYNIKHPMQLTEDRTIANTWAIPGLLSDYVMQSEDSNFIEKVLTAPDTTYERRLDFDRSWIDPSKEFLARAEDTWKSRRLHVNPTLIKCIVRNSPHVEVISDVTLTPVQQNMLQKAKNFLKVLGYALDEYTIRVVDDLGGHEILAEVKHGTIFLSKRVFEQGTKQVASTLMEEYLHIRHGYIDCSRALQTALFDKIISLGEELRGEPL